MALRILLADNNIATQKMGMKILAAAGHDVFTVSNGVAAIKRIVEFHPEVLMLDAHLPGHDGIEICEKVKSMPDMAGVAILLTVGKMEPLPAAEGINAKADGFITKPFEAGELITTIEKLAERVHPSDARISPHFDVPKLSQSAYRHTLVARPVEQIAQAAPRARESNMAALAETSSLAPLRQQDGEVCDVCGYVNQEHTFACQKCDVPLPSSVRSFRGC